MDVDSGKLNPQDSSLGTKRSIISQSVLQQISLAAVLCQAEYTATCSPQLSVEEASARESLWRCWTRGDSKRQVGFASH